MFQATPLAFLLLQGAVPAPMLLPSPVQSAPAERNGVPGQVPGTERWLVTLKDRSFDLREFRLANHDPEASADDVARIVRGLENRVREDQKDFVTFIEKLGGTVTAQWWLINGCAVDVPAAAVHRVRRHPRVLKLDPDELVYPAGYRIKDATNAKNHNTDIVTAQGLRGRGVMVAIMDTGLDNPMGSSNRPHRTFFVDGDINNMTGGGIGGSRLLTNQTYGKAGPDDVHGHGTAVAGIAIGEVWGTPGADRGHAPLAGVGGYCIADSAGGGAHFVNIVNAWQAIARDAKQYNTVAANNSYTGSPDPTHASQQALDSAALNANVLPVCAAGNSSSSTSRSQSVANGLAVGACHNLGAKTMTSFSCRGPLYGDLERFYPDLCANGFKTVMPLRDNESKDLVASGTSMASPQVCGAAGWFRAAVPTADTMQTRAAILATTEDVSKQNSKAPYNTRNAYGLGYLRSDRLMALAKGGGLITKGTISSTATPVTFTFAVQRGRGYSFVIAWNRLVMSSANWSDLDLEIKRGAQTLGRSAGPRNLYERVRILAPVSGPVEIRVSAKTLEQKSVSFALVASEIPPPFISGDMIPYGLGCLGTGIQKGVDIVLPAVYAAKFPTTYHELGLGYNNHRCQQVFGQNAVPAKFRALQIAFRLEDVAFGGAVKDYWAELEIKMGYPPNPPDKLSETLAQNIVGTPITVLAKKRVRLPDYLGPNPSPDNWEVKIGLDRPCVHITQAQRYLFVDITKTDSSVGNRITNYYVDAFLDQQNYYASRVYAPTPAATKGTIAKGLGSVIGFNVATSGAVPALTNEGVPEIGGTYRLLLGQAAVNSAAVFLIGLSDQKWGAFTLPLDLTRIGAPGCKLLASIDLALAVPTSARGSASLSLSVPLDKALIQGNVFYQAAVVDPRANPLGLAWTNGLRGIIGGQP